MNLLNFAKIGAITAVAGTILAACVVVEEGPSGPGMRPPPGPPPGQGSICTREYAPVCAERRGDRQTFGNSCVARSEGFRVVHPGECRAEQRPWERACTREYRPVCAERRGDRQSFNNPCEAESNGYRIIRDGECRGGGGGGRWR